MEGIKREYNAENDIAPNIPWYVMRLINVIERLENRVDELESEIQILTTDTEY